MYQTIRKVNPQNMQIGMVIKLGQFETIQKETAKQNESELQDLLDVK